MTNRLKVMPGRTRVIGTRARGKGNRPLNKVDELAFKAWAETGSLDNARLYFEKQKILHDNGKQYSVAGIRYCAMRYMIRNYEDAISFITQEYEKRGIIPNIESIEATLIGYAVEVLKYKTDIVEWATEHNLMEKYQNVIEERTRNAPVDTRRRIFIHQVQP